MDRRSKLSDGPADGSSRLWFQSLSSVERQSLRLFCFLYAGGNAYGFRSWQRHFPPDIDLCLVHLPGRGKRGR
ncbi:MAG: thioesterase II family protein [Candidatus Sulfotelmatobacter sp.]